MPHHLRRILSAVAIFMAAGLIYQTWRQHQPGYGLFDLLKGRPGELATVGAPKLGEDDMPVLAKFSQESMKLAAAVLPAVVSINTDTMVDPVPILDFRGNVNLRYRLSMSLGSGVIIDGGYVVTNQHVVENAARIKVITNDHVKHDVEFIGSNEESDIAVLRILGGGSFPTLSFANSDEARVGQVVFAVGNPFGLSGTVTQGIISATQRQLSDNGRPFLQTDTVINPGNSGGPLVDIHGQIVGINQALYAPGSQGSRDRLQTWSGVGLTIPSNDAKAAVDAIIKNAASGGKARGYLGLDFSPVPVQVDLSLISSAVGARVVRVAPGSPGEKAGFQPGDVIIKFSDTDFRSPEELMQLIRRAKPGIVESISVVRGGARFNFVVTVGREP